MVADRIKTLRESGGMTQAELAKRLGISRSSVNAWEQGISSPSTQYIVEFSHIFKVSTDYLLITEKKVPQSTQCAGVLFFSYFAALFYYINLPALILCFYLNIPI